MAETSRLRSSTSRSDYLSDTRYEFEALAPEAPGTETDKIKGVTRDKNCGVDKHPLFSLASLGPVIFSRSSSRLFLFLSRPTRRPDSRQPVAHGVFRWKATPALPLIPGSLVPPIFHEEIRYRHFRVARISNDRPLEVAGICAGGSWGGQERATAAAGPRGVAADRFRDGGKGVEKSHAFFRRPFSARGALTHSVLSIAFVVPTARKGELGRYHNFYRTARKSRRPRAHCK